MYLLEISITQNKKRILLLRLLINCKAVRLAPQILPIKNECTFLYLNFQTIGIFNPSANSFLEITSFLIAPLDIFFIK